MSVPTFPPTSTAPGAVPTSGTGPAAGADVLAAPPGPWSVADLPDFSQTTQRYEILDGCLHATPPSGDDHQLLVDRVVELLRGTAPPSWRPVSQVGLHLGTSFPFPDAVVLRPGTPQDVDWADPVDVALVVEVESVHSRRIDRLLKPALYAEADIESYWRVEPSVGGPMIHLYTKPAGGHYQLHRCVHAGQCVTAELPYAVQLAPASWH